MWNIVTYRLVLFIIILSTLCFSCGEDQKIDWYSQAPSFSKTKLFENGDQPNRIRNFRDTLFVSFLNKPEIEMYDLNLNFLSSIPLTDLDTVIPTSFHITDSSMLVTENRKNRVILYSRDGKVISSFGSMPDNFIKLFPFDIIVYRGVAYITDILQKSVLAVSLTTTKDITEFGELILTIPKDSSHKIQFPSAVTISSDGRLYVGDAASGNISVFTCDGNYVYQFDSITTDTKLAIQAFAFDNIVDIEMLKKDETSFDPSGIRNQGRLHALDVNNKQVHLYSPIGKYINSYPSDSSLVSPTGIAIDVIQKQVFITDAKASKIIVFSY